MSAWSLRWFPLAHFLLLSGLLLAACTPTAPSTQPPTQLPMLESTDETQVEETPSTEAASPALKPSPTTALNAEDLPGMLLELADLPDGWQADAAVGETETDQSSYRLLCKEFPSASHLSAEVNFKQSDNGPYFSQRITLYSTAQAKTALKHVRSAAADCGEFSLPDSTGKQISFQVSDLEFPKLGDESVALRITQPLKRGAVVTDAVYVRYSRLLSTFNHIAITQDETTLDSSQTLALIELAEAKIRARLP